MKKKSKTWNVAFSMSATIQVKASSAEDAEAQVEAMSDEDLMHYMKDSYDSEATPAYPRTRRRSRNV